MEIVTAHHTLPTTFRDSERHPEAWAAAQALEASFLAEMLKTANVGAPPDTFGGGVGEDHFSGFLVDEYARSMSARGGIGLAEYIYRSIVRGTAT